MVDEKGRLAGLLTRSQMIASARQADLLRPLMEDANIEPVTVSPGQTLKSCAAMMAESGLTSFPVVGADGRLVGVIIINDLLKGRSREEQRENARERIIRLRWPFGGREVVGVVEPAEPAARAAIEVLGEGPEVAEEVRR